MMKTSFGNPLLPKLRASFDVDNANNLCLGVFNQIQCFVRKPANQCQTDILICY